MSWLLDRHRRAVFVVAAVVMFLVGAGGVFVYEWNHSGPQELSGSTALQRFRSGTAIRVVDPKALHPASGVYSYTGKAAEHVSLPPKSQTEGPRFYGTVSYLPDSCWTFRIDYSNSHWQSTTYCPRGNNLVEVGRAGWYKWDFVALTIADTATFTCQEMAIPAVMTVGARLAFACSGTNNPLNTGTVTMVGTTQYLGTQVLHVGGTSVLTLHFREVARFGGGQSGTNVADTWMSTTDGLPIRGTWTTEVSTPSPLGTSVMTGSATFALASLTPKT